MTGWHLLMAFGWAATAPSPQIPIRIEFQGPPNCSSAESFYAGVRARTDRVRRAAPGEAGVQFRVQLTRRGTSVHGELGRFDEEGATEARGVDGDTCDEVVEALSLTAALALDPNARLAATLPPVALDERNEPTAERQPQPQPQPLPRREFRPIPPFEVPEDLEERAEDEELSGEHPSSSAPLFMELGIHAAGMQVLESDLSVGGAVFVRLGYAGGVLSPSLAVSVMQVRNDVFGSALDANAALTGAALTTCPLRFSLGDRLRMEPCARVLGGFVNVAGRNLIRPESVVRSWWSAGPLARAAAALGSQVSLELELGVDFPFVRRRFLTTQGELVARTPTLGPLGAVGLAYLF